MSTVEIPIETALQHAVTRPSTSPKTGTKRKGRASVSGQRPAVNNARVTRRSALDGEAEPARGEEENLIGHPSGGSTAKRRRQSSSRYNAQAEKINPNIDPALQDTGTSSADVKKAGASSSQHRFPYPYGLTPFRYPCLTPHLPAPPPGDPLNPSFQRFDPSASLSSQTDLSESSTLPEPSSSALNLPIENPYAFGPDATADAYESLTALLDASGPHGANPSSPGERSDGKGGPLTPKMQGRYHMASKDGCEDCRDGKGGHWGHWVKSSGDFASGEA